MEKTKNKQEKKAKSSRSDSSERRKQERKKRKLEKKAREKNNNSSSSDIEIDDRKSKKKKQEQLVLEDSSDDATYSNCSRRALLGVLDVHVPNPMSKERIQRSILNCLCKVNLFSFFFYWTSFPKMTSISFSLLLTSDTLSRNDFHTHLG